MIKLMMGAGLALAANVTVYVALAFMNGVLLPTHLGGVYQVVSPFWRLAIMSASLFVFGNFLFGKVYAVVDPASAAMVILVSAVMVQISKSVLLGTGVVTPRVMVSGLALAAAAAWVSWELHHSMPQG